MEKETKTTTVRSGIGFTGLLTIAFIVLKLCKVISWSWVWVLAPLWMSWAVALVTIILVSIVTLIIGLFIKKKIDEEDE